MPWSQAWSPRGTPAEAAVTKPSASNTGVPAGKALTKYTGPLTITTAGTVIDGKAVYGDLRIQAKNVIIRNSYLHCGTNIPSGNSGCIDANSGTVYNLQVLNNTIIPDRPSYYRDGIVGHEYTARYNHISRTNDGLGIFNKPGGSVNANVTAEYNYIHDLTHWNHDPAHSEAPITTVFRCRADRTSPSDTTTLSDRWWRVTDRVPMERTRVLR